MKKLYRVKGDYKIAGVCGGLGEYFNVDPVFLRVLFIVIIPLGGVGFLAYLLMWIMVPEKGGSKQRSSSKKLFLSNKDKKIAGVCGGMGEFYDVDPVLFRVGFVALIILGGAGIAVYLILWLVLPSKTEVVTTTKKSVTKKKADPK